MRSLISKIKKLQNSEINPLVEKRLREFSSFSSKSKKEWFSELCFCILAANSKQKTSEAIQRQLSIEKIKNMTERQLAELIRNNKHRFHNNKAKYLKEALHHINIKDTINQQLRNSDIIKVREFLVHNIKGIGMKEASHFLRNTGIDNGQIAILDRHILHVMHEHKLIDSMPKSLTINTYLNIENKFVSLAKKLNMPPAKLDLFMWHMKTGEVLK